MLFWLTLFLLALVMRYLRLVVSIYTYLSYRPYLAAIEPKFGAHDVTVVVPTTFKVPAELVQCLRCISNCSPNNILIVTAKGNVDLAQDLCALNDFRKVTVLGIDKLNKRNQMIKALKEVDTDIVVFADDDVFWPTQYLEHLLAIFENPMVGAGGTRQRVRRNPVPNTWNFLGISYLERRVWNNITTNAIDGSISTLSGRSAAYRAKILKNEAFFHYFTHDSWLGRLLNTDDDKCLTRYVYSHGWEIALQTAVVLETSLEANPKYIQQCLRWARAHWRGNFTVMTNESYWRSLKYAWGCYVIYTGQFQTPALLVDGILFTLLSWSLPVTSPSWNNSILAAFGAWLLFTKMVKLVPHFCKHPSDLKFLPVSIAFAYLHGFLNIYALCTLTTTAWGSQQLDQLEKPRAQASEVLPLLRQTMAGAVEYPEPTPGREMVGNDYFSVSRAPVESA